MSVGDMSAIEIVELLALFLLMLNFLAFIFMLGLSAEFGFEFDWLKIFGRSFVVSGFVVGMLRIWVGQE